MYNQEKQYRCTIIRGKSQTEMDDLLPIYALVLHEICPCNKKDFVRAFNDALMTYLPEREHVKKTLDNHRTEICGKLFGMYYLKDGVYYESERTKKYLDDSDQPAFFKDICYKMQFPNGMQTKKTVISRVNDKICIRPNAFLLKFLLLASDEKVCISKKDVGYYILNSLDVLQGEASPKEVLQAIVKDRNDNIHRDISNRKADSYNWQHINEQMNYLALANLIRFDKNNIVLNPKEMDVIQLFAEGWNKKPMFDVSSYDLLNDARKFQSDWDLYYSSLSDCSDKFTTTIDAVNFSLSRTNENVANVNVISEPQSEPSSNTSTTDLGDDGERKVYEYEKKRVTEYDASLANKVLLLGRVRGLGYDIQSVIAEPVENATYKKYIEVKSTKRVTRPNFNDALWGDSVNLTPNEWDTASQLREYYYVYRVFFTNDGDLAYIIQNPVKKAEENKLKKQAIVGYKLSFSNLAIDNVIQDI